LTIHFLVQCPEFFQVNISFYVIYYYFSSCQKQFNFDVFSITIPVYKNHNALVLSTVSFPFQIYFSPFSSSATSCISTPLFPSRPSSFLSSETKFKQFFEEHEFEDAA
jgi:hypothetical protein